MPAEHLGLEFQPIASPIVRHQEANRDFAGALEHNLRRVSPFEEHAVLRVVVPLASTVCLGDRRWKLFFEPRFCVMPTPAPGERLDMRGTGSTAERSVQRLHAVVRVRNFDVTGQLASQLRARLEIDDPHPPFRAADRHLQLLEIGFAAGLQQDRQPNLRFDDSLTVRFGVFLRRHVLAFDDRTDVDGHAHKLTCQDLLPRAAHRSQKTIRHEAAHGNECHAHVGPPFPGT